MNALRALCGLALASMLCGCVSYTPPAAPKLATLQPIAAPPQPVTAYLVYNGFHAGLTVPSAVVRAHPGATAQAQARLPAAPWTSLGYGDAKFYQHQGINPARVLDFVRSMLRPGNPSVVQLRAVQDPLNDPSHPHLLRILIAPERAAALVARVDASFAGDRAQFVAYGLGGAGDQFFRGARPASAIHECNQWIGDVLGAAGVPHTPLVDTAAPGLAWDLRRRGYAEGVGGG